jgi:hypothetical protein
MVTSLAVPVRTKVRMIVSRCRMYTTSAGVFGVPIATSRA